MTIEISKYSWNFPLFSLQQTDPELMTLGFGDLRVALCRVMREPKPHECHALGSADSINAMKFGIVFASIALLGFTKLF